MVEMRGGRKATSVEVEMMIEARRKLVEICEEFGGGGGGMVGDGGGKFKGGGWLFEGSDDILEDGGGGASCGGEGRLSVNSWVKN
ncbi:hypothetical protein Tco_1578253 [Tanacetum coccineum]